MKNNCPACYGTGSVFGGSYCSCTNGDLAKAMDIAKKRANWAEKVKKAEESGGQIFEIGDWIESGDLIGTIDEIDGERVRFLGHHYKAIPDKACDISGWTSIAYVKRLPIERFEDVGEKDIDSWLGELAFQRSIDLALDNHDEEQFYKLAGKGGKPLTW